MDEPVVRFALESDDLSEVYPHGEGELQWNRNQVIVATIHRHVVGAVVFWDAGHPLVYVANLHVLAPFQKRYVGYRMIEFINQYCCIHDKAGFVWTSNDHLLIKDAVEHGAIVSAQPYYILTMVTTACQA